MVFWFAEGHGNLPCGSMCNYSLCAGEGGSQKVGQQIWENVACVITHKDCSHGTYMYCVYTGNRKFRCCSTHSTPTNPTLKHVLWPLTYLWAVLQGGFTDVGNQMPWRPLQWDCQVPQIVASQQSCCSHN